MNEEHRIIWSKALLQRTAHRAARKSWRKPSLLPRKRSPTIVGDGVVKAALTLIREKLNDARDKVNVPKETMIAKGTKTPLNGRPPEGYRNDGQATQACGVNASGAHGRGSGSFIPKSSCISAVPYTIGIQLMCRNVRREV